MEELYSGKAKTLYRIEPGKLLMRFRDDVTAFDGKRKEVAGGKGVLSAKTSAKLFELLEEAGIPTHYICYRGGPDMIVKEAKVIPIEVIVRNYAYGSLLKRMPLLKPLQKFTRPIIELHFKSDELHDPLILPQDVIEAGLLTEDELREVERLALEVNNVLRNFFESKGYRLIDFKIEVGRVDGKLVVVDELSGDTMRILDSEGRHLDKEVFRKGGSVQELLEAYKRLAEIVGEPRRVCEQ
ncbi:phosphoribosylaminoimidazole-succinocarboxamides ynthase [Pyrolobus fumarii 1A]|uniref:Phosphoribosylaminoimidazole-succinocarboxamide synthase n=1 Tax=Pyrolobus fumarii (strain DSM 11204 / 1A) TaxID=694429 RepID=G0EGT3_PYRF1|nr:phosphoribosylaminoimidazole-succinocarboxamides ynthase [Pyrolobus fumarii 1A]